MKSIVIIDDEPVIREMMARHLEALGWSVLQTDNGDEGLALVSAHRPAAVLCDLLMPGTTGFNVCRTIRARRDELGDVTLIVTTGSNFQADRQNAFEAGADHFLVKPVTADQIAEIIGSIPFPVPAAPEPPHRPAEAVDIRFWGVRGSIATPGAETVRYGGNTTCVEIRSGNDLLILDAGTGIRPLGMQLRREAAGQPVRANILLTHTHWDHIQGLPFFGPAHDHGSSITVFGYEGAKQSLLKTLAAQMDSTFFPIGMDQLAGNLTVRELHELDFRVGHIPVQAIFTNHPGITLGYRLGTVAGAIVFLPDTEILPVGRQRPAGTDPAPDPEADQFNAYKNQLLAEFIQGCEVLICDAQYTAEEYERRVGWGHSCVDDTVQLALQAKVRHLVLFHHDPTHDDAMIDAMVARARAQAEAAGSALRIEAAAEGRCLHLERKARCPAAPAAQHP